ncbi:phosphoribosylanthranilate isomerase [Archangium violaceum]|uniref:N-(5'-phosphoribosyl)anthranilate isomerase n=1 Tax=Archangium violaceum Cb vi76 TaxID=1406225 RepID=A0A084SFW4_9BACT|nr:phosphoribosylanthranilate isomerase [Archangium violaceum]KFA87349.1 N-(5'-phosphoribosyl)anthranilate isomerase [Archangium violaceum Cb vi76]
MEASSTPRVKVCCISSVEEARAAIRAGVSALGLVSSMPSGPGVISEALITEIAATVPPSIGTFLLTCGQDARDIIAQQRRCRTNTVQLCDRLTAGTYADLRGAMPGISLVQVIHVTGEESLEEALSVAPHVDALLLDSGNQALAVKELGGTGRVHDWSISRRIREQVNVPVFLAGGLRPENVGEAIRQVGPFGLDLCSGVRTEGRLDTEKLARFFTRLRA